MTETIKPEAVSKCPHSETSAGKEQRRGDVVSDDPQLPMREIAFYLVALVSIITYAGYDFYLTYGKDPTEILPSYLLREGWWRPYKDAGEDSLMTHAAMIWQQILVASIGFLLVSKATLLWTPMACHQIVCSIYTLAMIALAISPQVAVCMTAAYVLVLYLSYYSHAAVWVVVLSLMYTHNIRALHGYIVVQLQVLTDVKLNMYTPSFGYLMCRLISFSHGLRKRLSERQQSGQPTPTLLEYLRENLSVALHYTFYMPYYWCGPILTFDMFQDQLAARGRVAAVDRATVIRVAWRCFRMLVWYFIMQVIFHYLPVGSYLYGLQESDKIKYKHLSFAMFLHGQNFMLLYVQFYGWPGSLAKLDGIQLLHWPDCISWVYSYSIMWRVFDRGLHAIIKTHIYLPIKGNSSGVLRHFLGVVACFVFICIFHGDTSYIRVWTTLNVVQLLTERVVIFVYRKHLKATVIKYLGPRNEKRVTSYFIGWNMMASNGIIFFLLANENGFFILPEYLLLRGSASRHTPVWHMLTKQFAVYCCVQIGKYYERTFKPVSCEKKMRMA